MLDKRIDDGYCFQKNPRSTASASPAPSSPSRIRDRGHNASIDYEKIISNFFKLHNQNSFKIIYVKLKR